MKPFLLFVLLAACSGAEFTPEALRTSGDAGAGGMPQAGAGGAPQAGTGGAGTGGAPQAGTGGALQAAGGAPEGGTGGELEAGAGGAPEAGAGGATGPDPIACEAGTTCGLGGEISAGECDAWCVATCEGATSNGAQCYSAHGGEQAHCKCFFQ